MTEQKPEKKVVSRTVAVGLGIVCIVLSAFLAGAIVSMNAQITKLQSQVNNFNDIVNMNESEVIMNQTVNIPPQPESFQWPFTVSYSGYLRVYVQPSNASVQIWVRVNWVYGFPGPSTFLVYDENRSYSGFVTYATLYYPIVQSPDLIVAAPNVIVSIGSNSPDTITSNVTITYHY